MTWQQFWGPWVFGAFIWLAPGFTYTATQGVFPVQVTMDDFTLGIKNVSVNPSDPKIWKKFVEQPFTTVGGGASKYVLKNRSGRQMVVDNCKTLFEADFGDFIRLQPVIGGWGEYREWAYNCYNALFVHIMKPSQVSYVSDFKLTPSAVKLLPANMMSPYEFDNPNEGVHLTGDIGSALPMHPADISNDQKGGGVKVDYRSGGQQYFSVIACGDYNHDGIEDILIGTYYAIGGGGTLTYNESFIITRTRPKGPFRILKSFWPTDGKYPFKKWMKVGP